MKRKYHKHLAALTMMRNAMIKTCRNVDRDGVKKPVLKIFESTGNQIVMK